MNSLEYLFNQNRQWAESMIADDPSYFQKLSLPQKPEFLWVCCSDSRITPVRSVGLLPGEIFVHRNIANLIIHTDMNFLSVLQYAVTDLRVRHIIVCGHYDCGGVTAALENKRLGLIDNWLRNIHDIIRNYESELEKHLTPGEKSDRLCEFNVIEQVINAGQTTIVQNAWHVGQNLSVHGWIYRLSDGIYQDMGVTISSLDDLESLRRKTAHQRVQRGIGI